MPKKNIVFSPSAQNLAETMRLVEIAKEIVHHPVASNVFDVHFISFGGNFETLIENQGFALTRMEPHVTAEKINHLYKVDRMEKFSPGFTVKESKARAENEIKLFKSLQPVAVVTGADVSTPVVCRFLNIPFVWVIQSTWKGELFNTEEFRKIMHTDSLLYKIGSGLALFWMNFAYINTANKVAKFLGVPRFKSFSEFCTGDITFFAEPPQFTGAKLPSKHYYIGTLLPRNEFTLPKEVTSIPRDKPLIYFSMGSSGNPSIIAKIVESFEGKPYYVIAPVKYHLSKLPSVRIPTNVMVTDWLPDLEINKMADLLVIHGGIGTVLTAALAGKPVVGVAMQMEQYANLACLERLGFAKQVQKSKDPSQKIQVAIQSLLNNKDAIEKAKDFAGKIQEWQNGPKMAVELLLQHYGG